MTRIRGKKYIPWHTERVGADVRLPHEGPIDLCELFKKYNFNRNYAGSYSVFRAIVLTMYSDGALNAEQRDMFLGGEGEAECGESGSGGTGNKTDS